MIPPNLFPSGRWRPGPRVAHDNGGLEAPTVANPVEDPTRLEATVYK